MERRTLLTVGGGALVALGAGWALNRPDPETGLLPGAANAQTSDGALPEVMEMVQGGVKGTAVTNTIIHQDSILQPDQPPTNLPQLDRWQRPASDLPPYLQRMQRLLRGVQAQFAIIRGGTLPALRALAHAGGAR